MKSVLNDRARTGAAADKGTGPGGKYLIFQLDNQDYGIAILKVHEILGLMDITKVPRSPDFPEGAISLRGEVIPVIDLRSKFGLAPTEHDDQTCIIVVDVGRMMGIIVDTVSQVHDIPSAGIEPAPGRCGTIDARFILGMGKVKDEPKILLDIDKVLADQ